MLYTFGPSVKCRRPLHEKKDPGRWPRSLPRRWGTTKTSAVRRGLESKTRIVVWRSSRGGTRTPDPVINSASYSVAAPLCVNRLRAPRGIMLPTCYPGGGRPVPTRRSPPNGCGVISCAAGVTCSWGSPQGVYTSVLLGVSPWRPPTARSFGLPLITMRTTPSWSQVGTAMELHLLVPGS